VRDLAVRAKSMRAARAMSGRAARAMSGRAAARVHGSLRARDELARSACAHVRAFAARLSLSCCRRAPDERFFPVSSVVALRSGRARNRSKCALAALTGAASRR
jgi:hypothetical protein